MRVKAGRVALFAEMCHAIEAGWRRDEDGDLSAVDRCQTVAVKLYNDADDRSSMLSGF